MEPDGEISFFDQVDFVKQRQQQERELERSAVLNGSKIWSLWEHEMAILRRTEKVMMRALCEVKLIEKRSQELVSLLGLKDILNGLARASGVRWYGLVLRRDNRDVLRRALGFGVAGRRGRGRPNMTWKRQVEEHINQIGLKKEDASDRTKWCDGIYKLSRNMS